MFYTMCMKCGEQWALGDERSCKCRPKTEAMTREDIIRMAREAGVSRKYRAKSEALERFAALVAAEKDEKIAKLQGEIDRMHRDLATIIKGVMRRQPQ